MLNTPDEDPFLFISQVCQVSAQQPVQTELLMRYHQLQSRLATLKIENEEVRASVHTNLSESFQEPCSCSLQSSVLLQGSNRWLGTPNYIDGR